MGLIFFLNIKVALYGTIAYLLCVWKFVQKSFKSLSKMFGSSCNLLYLKTASIFTQMILYSTII